MQDPPGSNDLRFQELPDDSSLTQDPCKKDSAETDLADILPGVIWVYSDDLHYLLYVNAAYERVWGYPTESLYHIPLSWIDAVCPDDRAKAWLPFRCGTMR